MTANNVGLETIDDATIVVAETANPSMAVGSGSKKQILAKFGLEFEIAGMRIPLESKSHATTGSGSSTFSEFMKNVRFGTPEDIEVVLELKKFNQWLQSKGHTIPDFLSDLADGTTITIYRLMITGRGEFAFAMNINFEDPLFSAQTDGLFGINNIYFSLSCLEDKDAFDDSPKEIDDPATDDDGLLRMFDENGNGVLKEADGNFFLLDEEGNYLNKDAEGNPKPISIDGDGKPTPPLFDINDNVIIFKEGVPQAIIQSDDEPAQ